MLVAKVATGGDLIKVFLTRFWLGFFMNVKWLGGGIKITPPPPPVISRTKQEQVRNMIFCVGLPCLKYFLKM